MPGEEENSAAIRALTTAARSGDAEDFRKQRSDFLESYGEVSPLIQTLVDSLEAQPDLDDTPKFLAQLLGVDAGTVIENSGSGATVLGDGAKAAGAKGVVAENLHGGVHHYHGTAGEKSGIGDPESDRQAYLNEVIRECGNVPLRGIDPRAAHAENTSAPDLANVYIGLNTTESVHVKEKGPDGGRDQPLTALESLHIHQGKEILRRVVLLGQPGSGKSTFVNHLCLAIARGDWNCLPGWPENERDLLPVRLNCREITPALGDPDEEKTACLDDFLKWLWADLKSKHLAGAARVIEEAFERGSALLVLDGLDEIADKTLRCRAAKLAEDFGTRYPDCRVIVSCRVHSYRQGRGEKKADPWVLGKSWHVATLAEFSPEQIDAFVAAWFKELHRTGNLTDAPADYIRSLKEALQRPDLRRLAVEPLMLTMMAVAHAHLGRLPEGRAMLYEELVRLLLWRWDDVHQRENPLTALLREKDFGQIDLTRVLSQVAFEVTQDGGAGEAPGNFARGAVESALRRELSEDDHWIVEVIDAMRGRAGLLREEEDDIFRVPHRTFQEYLAARHLANTADFDAEAGKLIRSDPALWREVILLACGYLVFVKEDGLAKPVALAACLCPKKAPTTDKLRRCEPLAGEIVLEIGTQRVRNFPVAREIRLLDRIRRRLASQVSRGRHEAATRIETGQILGRLGDPRPGVGLDENGLPDIEWCPIETGDFLYGDEKETRTIEEPFEIARYPVTVAQFGAFIGDGGYAERRWWEAGGFGDFDGPEDYSVALQTANHPRTGVSWFEAMAFCAWLTEHIGRAEKRLITLPTEEQWERAARHADGRKFPWGDEEEKIEDRCNLSETGLDHTSAVGAFPAGEAKCGGQDFSGNVLEWCENQYDQEQYSRVLRGGSFWSDPVYVRCAGRDWLPPANRNLDIGFRVISSPIS